MQVRAALEESPTGVLRRMAASHGLPVDDATTRDELVDRLAERLADQTYVSELIASLADDEHAALLAARASGGELRGVLMDRDQPGAAPGLVERGLLFRTFAAAGPRRGEIFAIPDEVLAVLPAPPAAEPPPAHESPPAERRSTDPAFSLFALVSALARPGASLEAELQGWSAEPGGFEWSARWTFLRHLAEASSLLPSESTAGHLHASSATFQTTSARVDTASATLRRAFDDPVALADRLRRAYLRDRAWSELAASGVEDAESLAEPTLVRAAVLAGIDRLPEDAWITVDALSDWLRRTAPDFLREQLDARGLLLVESLAWEQLELPVLRHVLLGPAYWLGLVATSADGGLIARRAAPRPPEPEPCTWSDAGELLAPARARLATMLHAERYLVLEERGRISRYRLVQQHVAAALGSGGSIDECRRLLVRLSNGPLPVAVDERLAAWRARYGALAVRPAVLVEARSEDELESALAEASVQPFIQRRLGPRAAEVAAADALALAAALRTSGHLPRVDAALRLVSEPRRSYAGLVDEQVLEFLLVSLLAFEQARPERLAELEGAASLLARLLRQFPTERLRELRTAAERLAGDLRASPATSRTSATARRRSRRAPRASRDPAR